MNLEWKAKARPLETDQSRTHEIHHSEIITISTVSTSDIFPVNLCSSQPSLQNYALHFINYSSISFTDIIANTIGHFYNYSSSHYIEDSEKSEVVFKKKKFFIQHSCKGVKLGLGLLIGSKTSADVSFCCQFLWAEELSFKGHHLKCSQIGLQNSDSYKRNWEKEQEK